MRIKYFERSKIQYGYWTFQYGFKGWPSHPQNYAHYTGYQIYIRGRKHWKVFSKANLAVICREHGDELIVDGFSFFRKKKRHKVGYQTVNNWTRIYGRHMNERKPWAVDILGHFYRHMMREGGFK